jgi:two-component system, OmpR family, response regulator VanR
MTNKTIIFLEDDEFLRELYSLHLLQQGYEVIQAGNSNDIVKLIEQHKPALLITDLVMPEYEGTEAIFLVIEKFNIPIIAISSYAVFLPMVESVVTTTLLKPFSGDYLVQQVERILGKPAQ